MRTVAAASLITQAEARQESPVKKGLGKLTGTVTDPSGAAIVGANVTLRGEGGAELSTITDGSGNYSFSGVPRGVQVITVNQPTFDDYKNDSVMVVEGQTTQFNVQMHPLAESSTVNVVANQVQLVETGTSAVSNTLDEREVKAYPTNGRNFLSFIALSAGVSNQTGQDEIKVGVVGSAKFAVNGGRTEYNSFLIDGSDVLNTDVAASHGQSSLMVYPSIDSIGELKVLTSNYGAEYGRSASGTVLVTTKAGTPKLHGSAYEFIRNEFFNSRNYFDKASKKAPLYRRNDFGGSLGGPLVIPHIYTPATNKTFFFLSEEFRKERSPLQFNQGVPTDAERGYNILTGTQSPVADFSDVCPAKYGLVSPETFPDCPTYGDYTYDVAGYQLNQVPINPTATAFLNTGIIPRANATTGCISSTDSCYDATISPPTDYRQDLLRIDQTLPFQSNLSVVGIHDHWNTVVAVPQWANNVNSFPSVQNSFTGPGLSAIAHVTTLFTKSSLNDFSYGYTLQRIHLVDIPGPGVNLSRAGIDATPFGTIFSNNYGKIPGLVFGGNNTSYGGDGFNADTSFEPWNHTLATQTIRDAVTFFFGKHTILAGVQLVDARRTETDAANGGNTGDVQGTLTFSNVASAGTTRNAFADFLVGASESSPGPIKSFEQDNAQLPYTVSYKTLEPYVQDDYKVTSRLTLNLGLRLSLFSNWEPRNRSLYNWVQSSFVPGLSAGSNVAVNLAQGYLQTADTQSPIPFDGNIYSVLYNGLVRCGTPHLSASCQSSHIVNPAPRLGFAFDPTGHGTTSIRAGYGIFWEHGTGSEANAGSLLGSPPDILSVEQSYPLSYALIGKPNAQSQVTPAFPLNMTAIPPTTTWPYVQQWSFGVQQQVKQDTGVSVAYVGSKGTHLATEFQLNQLPPVTAGNNPFPAGQPITQSICNSATGLPQTADPPNTFNDPTTGIDVDYSKNPSAYTGLYAACNGTPPTFNSSGAFTHPALFYDPNYLRPLQGIGRVQAIRNIASSVYHSAQVTIRRNHGPLDASLSYTYSHSIDSSSDRYESTFVDAYDLAANRASSGFDQRHLLNITYVYQLPGLAFVRLLNNVFGCSSSHIASDDINCPPASRVAYGGPSKAAEFAFTGWSLSGITLFQTGTPFSVVNNGSPNGVSVLDNAGLLIGGSADSYADVNPHPSACTIAFPSVDINHEPGTFAPIRGNPCLFQAPRGLTQGNTGRNFLNNPNRTNFDVALLRTFKTPFETNLQFRAEAFNVFNHTQFITYDANRGNTAANTVSCYGDADTNYSAGAASCLTGNAFLRPIEAHRPRTLQFGLKFEF
jgi:hypothetical protein